MFKNFFVIILLVIFLASSFIIYNLYDNKEKNNHTDNTTIHEQLVNEEIKEEIDTEILVEEKKVEDPTPETSTQKEIKNDTSTTKEETKKESSSSQNIITENKTENINTPITENFIKVEKKDEEIKTISAWDELGISEYEYYYSPMWKWQEVKFGIYVDNENKCNNMSDCRNKCINYGELLLETNNGGYICNEVYSYSNNYLGEQFIFKYLEQ